MNILELGAIGELVGRVAVLATLAYLAMQTRNAARFSAAEAPQRILDGFKTWFQPLGTRAAPANALRGVTGRLSPPSSVVGSATRTRPPAEFGETSFFGPRIDPGNQVSTPF